MKLWILAARTETNIKNDPFIPWYDKMFGIVVRAENEEIARYIASENNGEEKPEAWLNEDYSTCEEILSDGEEMVILRDVTMA